MEFIAGLESDLCDVKEVIIPDKVLPHLYELSQAAHSEEIVAYANDLDFKSSFEKAVPEQYDCNNYDDSSTVDRGRGPI
jgi:hypothetical protein